MAVALHPERTEDDATLRWQVAGPLLDGVVARALAELVTDGVLAAVTVGDDHVLTTLAPGRSWPAVAAQVRAAVVADVELARQAPADEGTDAALARAAQLVLHRVAPYAAGHGGAITLRDVHHGVVEVEMHGACHGCPAAQFTVQGKIARDLAAEPGFTEVHVHH